MTNFSEGDAEPGQPVDVNYPDTSEIEIQQHKLPEAFQYPTKAEMFAQILGHASIAELKKKEWS